MCVSVSCELAGRRRVVFEKLCWRAQKGQEVLFAVVAGGMNENNSSVPTDAKVFFCSGVGRRVTGESLIRPQASDRSV